MLENKLTGFFYIQRINNCLCIDTFLFSRLCCYKMVQRHEFGHFTIQIAIGDFRGSQELKQGSALDVQLDNCG